MQTVTLQVDDEAKAIGDAINVIIKDVKAGKSTMDELADGFNALKSALGSLSNAPADLKKVDNQVYLIRSIADAVETQPAPVAPTA